MGGLLEIRFRVGGLWRICGVRLGMRLGRVVRRLGCVAHLWGGGCSFDYLSNEKYAFGVSFDYYHAFSDLMKNRYLVGMTWRIMM